MCKAKFWSLLLTPWICAFLKFSCLGKWQTSCTCCSGQNSWQWVWCFSFSHVPHSNPPANPTSATSRICGQNASLLPPQLLVPIIFTSHLDYYCSFLCIVPDPGLAPSSPHFSDCYFLELGIRDGISEMVYNFHVISPVSKAERRVESMKKTVPRIGLSVYKGSNEKNSSKLKVLQSFTWTLESLPERHTWGWSHGKKNKRKI